MSVTKEPRYITTPIYYVTDAPHIGHLYTTVAADVLARFYRARGHRVHFLTGTDEHGQKIQKKAQQENLTPLELANRVVERYRSTWKLFQITHDDFIRTTEARHKRVVQHYLEKLMQQGDIYLGEYVGLYCTPDEAYWTKTQAPDKKCPDCGRPLDLLTEESYFFRLSHYAPRLRTYIKEHPDFIFPAARRNEVLGFLDQDIQDLSASRTTLDWGIPMPYDAKATKEHKVYVWFDALVNYLSALNPLGDSQYPTLMDPFWPCAIHLVGKDILRFHAVYWPSFLMALGLPLPRHIVAHGWLLSTEQKIGKSLGNAVSPTALAEEFGCDAIRFFLFRHFTFGQDGEYSSQSLRQVYESDLANAYGNCVNRVANMLFKQWGTQKLNRQRALGLACELRSITEAAVPRMMQALEGYHFEQSLSALWEIISATNRFLERESPWKKVKDPALAEHVEHILLQSAEALRIASLLLWPWIPGTAIKALEQLDAQTTLDQTHLLDAPLAWGFGSTSYQPQPPTPLFPKERLTQKI